MKQFMLRKGLDLPILGAPRVDAIGEAPPVRTVAVLGDDYLGLKPRVSVQEGDPVGAGSALFAHKDNPGAMITSPAAGHVRAINRGERRRLISIEVDLDPSAAPPVDFSDVGDIDTRQGLAARLGAAGLWTSFRTRPYSKVPALDAVPAAIFVNAMDSEPLAPDPAHTLAHASEAFRTGLTAVSRLCDEDGKTYLCQPQGADIADDLGPGVEAVTFSGPHPAGLPGTHIHFLHPPTAERPVWTIGYQDVIAIGRLLQSGHLDGERVIALAGPLCRAPRLLRTVMGASLMDLTTGELHDGSDARLISGSVLSGRAGEGPTAYLGRYARQVTVIEEDREQIPFGWIRPMADKFAFQPVLGSALAKRVFALTSNLNGGRRAMVPTGTFEQLMPQDYLPTQLLRALLVMDTDTAQALGALELDEEDLGLVGFACPAKYEYGQALRDCLSKIEREG
ncbi:MAG: Na(+)-translocating NADH-quinone reductase subunit A [Pseudomonadota bacterium]